MYSKQLESKRSRSLTKVFDACYIYDDIYEERYKNFFKMHYNGKETKRFKRLNNKTEKADSFPRGMLESLLMM